MNIHDTTFVVLFLAGVLVLIGWSFGRICRVIARHDDFPVVPTISVGVIVALLFHYWLGLIGLFVIVALLPAWLLERRRWQRRRNDS